MFLPAMGIMVAFSIFFWIYNNSRKAEVQSTTVATSSVATDATDFKVVVGGNPSMSSFPKFSPPLGAVAITNEEQFKSLVARAQNRTNNGSSNFGAQ